MFQQVIDFHDESEALFQLLESLSDDDFERCTQFKNWTINNILRHLHVWNRAATMALVEPAEFQAFLTQASPYIMKTQLSDFEHRYLSGSQARELLGTWNQGVTDLCEYYGPVEPKSRVVWAGPDMSVRSSVTARLMETWAHGQAIYDLLGIVRVDEDRIRNIAVLGVNTFGWTYKNRGMDIPPKVPYLSLRAPSGDTWEFNEPQLENVVRGSATEFCQVVTQTRNIADTSLDVLGNIATEWMSMAQCFAGPPMDPPTTGTRFTA